MSQPVVDKTFFFKAHLCTPRCFIYHGSRKIGASNRREKPNEKRHTCSDDLSIFEYCFYRLHHIGEDSMLTEYHLKNSDKREGKNEFNRCAIQSGIFTSL